MQIAVQGVAGIGVNGNKPVVPGGSHGLFAERPLPWVGLDTRQHGATLLCKFW